MGEPWVPPCENVTPQTAVTGTSAMNAGTRRR